MNRHPDEETRMAIGVTILLAILYVLFIAYPGTRDVTENGHQMVVLNRWRGTLCLLTLAAVVFAFVLGLKSFAHRKELKRLLLISAGLFPLVGMFGLVEDTASYSDQGTVTDSSGAEYHLLTQAFLQGSEAAIARVEHQSIFTQKLQILVMSPWEESFGCLNIVRPKNAPPSTKLFVTDSGILVGLPYDNSNLAFLAYDIQNDKPYSQIFNSNEGGYTDLRALSPFLLLKPNDEPRDDDYQTLLTVDSEGRPWKNAVQPDLQNANPKVVEMAKNVLESIRKNPPKP